MSIPYVIDNQTYRLSDILNALLQEHKGRSLDVATAYFTVGGFGLVKDGLLSLGNLRFRFKRGVPGCPYSSPPLPSPGRRKSSRKTMGCLPGHPRGTPLCGRFWEKGDGAVGQGIRQISQVVYGGRPSAGREARPCRGCILCPVGSSQSSSPVCSLGGR